MKESYSKDDLTVFCKTFVLTKINGSTLDSVIVDDVSLDDGLIETGVIDSFDLVELITAVETEFNVTLNLDSLNVRNISIKNIVNAVTTQTL